MEQHLQRPAGGKSAPQFESGQRGSADVRLRELSCRLRDWIKERLVRRWACRKNLRGGERVGALKLLASEGLHRVDFGGFASRQVASAECNEEEECGDEQDGNRRVRSDGEEGRSHQLC